MGLEQLLELKDILKLLVNDPSAGDGVEEIIFNWLNQINKGSYQITVFGNPDEKILDLVYIDDVINAILKVTENWSNDVYNVSTELGISITNLIKVIENELDIKLEVSIFPENRTDIENKRVGSSEKLKGLGWKPKNSINDGIKKTYEWIKILKASAF